jgi:hypothetical protein
MARANAAWPLACKDGVDKDSCAMDICGVEAEENIKVENLVFDKMYRETEEQVIILPNRNGLQAARHYVVIKGCSHLFKVHIFFI